MAREPPPTPARLAVAIIGGGVMGLAIGWRLAQAGCGVTLFERDEPGGGASWAAAGMLAAGCEAEPGELDLLALNRRSQELWPAFAAELERATGLAVGLREEGTLIVALTRDDAAQLRFSYDFQRQHGVALEWLSPAEARRREPHLHPNLAGAVFSPADHQVDNRLLVRALERAFVAAGGTLKSHTPVEAVETSDGRATGVRANGARHDADVVVLAAGAWSGQIKGLPGALPVRPVKGQMLALRMDAQAPLLSHVVWAPKAYLVPRHDGRLIVGATTEERGFDPNLTAGGILALLEGAWRAVPGIEDLPIDEMWVGFRPGSRDDAPMLGPSAVPGLVLATGHHRNGILLTPVTAETVARYVLEGEVDPVIRPFALARFGARATERA
jgi:glycine oxidase